MNPVVNANGGRPMGRPYNPAMRHPAWFAAALLLLARGAAADDDEKKPKPADPVDVPGFWTEDELRRIDQGLDVLNVTRKDLGFQKRPIEDAFRLECVDRILDEPLAIGQVAAEWDEVARAGHARALLAHAWGVFPQRWPGGDRAFNDVAIDEIVALLGPRTQDPLKRMMDVAKWLADWPKLVRSDVSITVPSDAEILRKALRTQVEKPSTQPAAKDLEDGDFLEAVQRVSFEKYFDAGNAHQAIPELVAVLGDSHLTVTGRHEFHTTAGAVLVYGTEDDLHPADEHAALVIDLGGNDTYLRGASASVLDKRPLSVVIDLAGDDRYLGENDFSFGGALGGVAIQWDCAGNDVYIGGNVSCGAGILGVGVLVDEGGNDTYRIKDFGQGAGAFGIGLLLEKGGHDLFHADLFGQGFASTWGCGMLVELAGNDVYDAGGAHLHAPLWRDRFQSLSQGFSIGMRPDASGGVGVLVDVSGNDRYSADIYGQGASYWYSLGLLIDDDGHDTYALGQYGQGSGIHLSAGMLLDRKGQDSYYDANGVGMGGAHDYSVGFLVDREGDDYYAGGGGAQGGALTNSVAMLIDDAGDDGYSATRGGTQGSATPARNTGGIGLLLDGAGKDFYSETTRNDGVVVQDMVGALLDEPTPEGKPSANAMAAAISKEDAAKKVETDGQKDGAWDLDKLWSMVTAWEVGDNTVVMPLARERFFALGAPALDRAIENLNANNSLLTRAIELTLKEFAKTDRAAIVERLLAKTKDPDKFVRKNSVAMLSALGATEALPRLTEMLTTDPDTTGTVLTALASMKTAPPEVVAMLLHAKEPVAVQAAVCLAAVADETSIAALALAMGPDFAFPVRLAACSQLAAVGAPALPTLRTIAADSKHPRMLRRNAIRALGGTKCPEAWTSLQGALQDSDPWIRLSAISAMDELLATFDAAARPSFAAELQAARAAETDPLVRRLVAPSPK